MNDSDEKKPNPDPADIKPVPGAEVEFLPGPETAEDGHKDKDGEDAPAAKAKAKKLRKSIETMKNAVRELEERLARAEAQAEAGRKDAAEFKDRYLRSLADMDNLRKRLEREKSDYFQYALSDVFKDFLPIIDNFERALKSSESEAGARQGLREGLDLILKQVFDLIRKYGVVPIERPDKVFDPAVHQAVFTEESEEASEPVVGEEFQKGYLINDRLLRPAMVKVLVPKKG